MEIDNNMLCRLSPNDEKFAKIVNEILSKVNERIDYITLKTDNLEELLPVLEKLFSIRVTKKLELLGENETTEEHIFYDLNIHSKDCSKFDVVFAYNKNFNYFNMPF